VEALVANGPAILFYAFAALALAGAVAVLFLLRMAEFVAIVQIFIYGGGIMVLFLFVIMLVNLHRLPEVKRFGGHWVGVALLAVLLLGVFGWFFIQADIPPATVRPGALTTVDGQDLGNPQAVAMALFTRYLLPFEIASIFLLIAMIGAVVLGRRQ
jgi:NADH-quinone oxidoreductase subunit J